MLLFVSRFNPTTMSQVSIKRTHNEVGFMRRNGFSNTVCNIDTNGPVITGKWGSLGFRVDMGERYPFKSPAIYISTITTYKSFYFKFGNLTITVPGSDEQHFQVYIANWHPSVKLYELIKCIEKELTELN